MSICSGGRLWMPLPGFANSKAFLRAVDEEPRSKSDCAAYHLYFSEYRLSGSPNTIMARDLARSPLNVRLNARFASKFASITGFPFLHWSRNVGSQRDGTSVSSGHGDAITVEQP